MGSHNSKVENKEDDELIEGTLPSTAISTPKIRTIDLDPRSPSANIVRTPIQMVQNLNQSPIIGAINTTCEENIDPRSPALEFTRTPIVIETIKFRNKNLDKVRQELTDFNTPIKQHIEISGHPDKIIGPKLLGVSPVIIRTEQSLKRNSYIGLLETDLDYIETNLDTLTKQHDNQIVSIVEEDKVEEIQNDEPVEISVNTLEEIGARALEIVAEIETGAEIETSVEETQLSEEIAEVNCSITKNESIISPIKLTLERISQIDKEIKEVIAHNPTVVFEDTSTTQEFDKKIANLIYEDEDILGKLPKCVKENSGNRTPLGDQNLNQRQRKSKLRVSEKMMKFKTNEYTVSKIPVFKEKKGKSKMVTQCENTPPRQKQNTKNRKSKWDSDNTLII